MPFGIDTLSLFRQGLKISLCVDQRRGICFLGVLNADDFAAQIAAFFFKPRQFLLDCGEAVAFAVEFNLRDFLELF